MHFQNSFMSSLRIRRPIGISFDVIEIDNFLPSIKMAVDIEMEHPTGKISYKVNDIWFECTQWDSFISALNKFGRNDKGEASLENMSNSFKISLIKVSNVIKFYFTAQEDNIGTGNALINYLSVIDDDLFNHIMGQFIEFEKWW